MHQRCKKLTELRRTGVLTKDDSIIVYDDFGYVWDTPALTRSRKKAKHMSLYTGLSGSESKVRKKSGDWTGWKSICHVRFFSSTEIMKISTV